GPATRAAAPAPRPAGPGGTAPTARHLPAIRRAMIGWTQDPGRNGARTWLRLIYQAAAVGMREPRFDSAAADSIVEGWRHLLPRAEMFYVAPAASTLVHHAAASLTGYKLHLDDLPADNGLLLFASPLRDEALTDDPEGRPITLVTWTLRRNTVLLEFWCPNSYVERSEQLGYTVPGMARLLAEHGGKLPANRVPGQVYPRHGYLYQRITPLVLHGPVDHDYLAGPWHDPDDDTGDVETQDAEEDGKPARVYTNPHGEGSAATIELQKLVAATFLVMGQTIIAETRMPATTAEQTAARRRGETDPEVRYVDLRATKYPTREHDDEPGGSGRTYRHSWYVRGHWRNQWYPSRGEHRPIWIDLHRAGPENAPLIGGERVNVLRR
ncbi:hypothetical protein, partial [Catenulispora subtropica]|uniref:hypothetical protein n=1 Tax=Catenulispora subtropica TaxID=450798 RepID=UPI0031DE3378